MIVDAQTVFGEAMLRLFPLLLRNNVFTEDREKGEISFTIGRAEGSSQSKLSLNRKQREELDQLFGEDWEVEATGMGTYSGGTFQEVTFKKVVFPKP